MDIKQMMDFPLSPSFSKPPTSAYSFDPRQLARLWHLYRDRGGVEVPIQSPMGDEDFWKLIAEIAQEPNLADIQSRLKSFIDQKSTRLRYSCEDASYKVLLPGHKMFLAEKRAFAFTSILKPGP